MTSESGSVTTPIGFAGAYTDANSGLLYLINRYYDPATGQFLTVDPGVAVTGQPYAYAGGDPVNQDDPTGLASTQKFWSTMCSGLFIEIPYIMVLCRLFPGGISLAPLGQNPSTRIPGDDNRGSIQIQGTYGSPKRNSGERFTYSVKWSQGNPPTIDNGVNMLDELIQKTPEKIVEQRTQALAAALNYMIRCSQNFGCSAPGKPTGWWDPGNHPSQRVDIPIYKGRAFIDNNGDQLASYHTGCLQGINV